MENREAIEWLKGCVVSYEVDNKGRPNGNVTCDLTQEVIDMAISALEKQIPKKPVWREIDITNDGIPDENAYCPVCGAEYEPDDIERIGFDYCYGCGQRLDWVYG